MASKFGFLPFVTKVTITGCRDFSARGFNDRTIREFSALTNVRELSIEKLYITSFISESQQYFGQFSTLTSLTMASAYGSGRHAVFFVGLFPRLENLEVSDRRNLFLATTGHDLTLVPSFVPPLRGRLTVNVNYAMDSIGISKTVHHCGAVPAKNIA